MNFLKPFNRCLCKYHKTQAGLAFIRRNWKSCIFHYHQVFLLGYHLDKVQFSQFNESLSKYRKKINKNNTCRNIGISGWELSHNAAGRVITLAQMYQYAGYSNVQIVGCVIGNKKNNPTIWEPIKAINIPFNYFTLQNNQLNSLLREATKFVINHPLDILHVSKPKLPNMVLAFLYKYIWQAKVIIDIDDEELAFAGLNRAFSQSEILTLQSYEKKLPTTIKDSFWTQVSVGLFNCFDEVTVSNPALQRSYGGLIIPHVRDEQVFTPSLVLKKQMRGLYDIPIDSTVVLFFGTPKRHKGLLETANAIADTDNDKFVYLIVGDFPDAALKEELLKIKNVNYIFLPNQPYNKAVQFAALGDICVLMQNIESGISNYQLPAKLVDALAMGQTVISQPTSALEDLIEAGCVLASSPSTLTNKLKMLATVPLQESILNKNHDYFLEKLSMKSHLQTIEKIVDVTPNKVFPKDDLDLLLCRSQRQDNLIRFFQHCLQGMDKCC